MARWVEQSSPAWRTFAFDILVGADESSDLLGVSGSPDKTLSVEGTWAGGSLAAYGTDDQGASTYPLHDLNTGDPIVFADDGVAVIRENPRDLLLVMTGGDSEGTTAVNARLTVR